MISYCKNGKSAQVLACPQDKLNEILAGLAKGGRGVPAVDHR